MLDAWKIAVNGDLGSGKSRLATGLAQRFDGEYVSSGQLQRRLATELGLSTLEMNLRAEIDPGIDELIDGELVRLGEADTSLVIDARLGFHFVPQALSIHLICHPRTAAVRIMRASRGEAESYADLDNAIEQLVQRRESERTRFRAKYEIEIDRLSQYNVVIQTDDATVEQVLLACERSASKYIFGKREVEQRVFLNRRSILPTQHIKETASLGLPWDYKGIDDRPISALVCDGKFYVVDGHKRLARHVHSSAPFIEANILGQDDELALSNLTAREYVHDAFSPSGAYDWEDAMKFRFKVPIV